MSQNQPSTGGRLTKIILVLAILLVAWNIFTGATVQEIGIPGFTIKFGPKPTVPPLTQPTPGPPLTSTNTVAPTFEKLPTKTPSPGPTSFRVCHSGCPFDQIGSAIEKAQPGETIIIDPGTYAENLVIDKSLKLQGAGSEQTRIEAKQPFPVLIIKSNTKILVELDGLSIGGGDVQGGAAGCIPQPEECLNGIVVRGQVQAVFTRIGVANNPDTGLWVRDTAQVTLTDSNVLNNGTAGLAVADSAKVTIQNTVISENKGRSVISAGMRVEGQSQVTLANTTLSGNAYSGLWVKESATVEIKDSTIKSSVGGFDYGSGVVVDGTAKVTLQGSTVEGNGTDTSCLAAKFKSQVCNGVMVSGQAQITIIDSIIQNNTDWGVTAVLKQCGYDDNLFIGQVTFIGNNVVQNNNRSGNHTGMGNPEGQICVP